MAMAAVAAAPSDGAGVSSPLNPARSCDLDQPLLQRRILFQPARKQVSASPAPPGIKPVNEGFEANGNLGKRTWQAMADDDLKKPTQEKNQEAADDLMLEWGTALKIGAGLENLGNTCFMNSVLQCLTYTPPLAKFLERGHHRTSCRHSGFCSMCALEGHVKQALHSYGKVIRPNIFVKNLRAICRSFNPFRQEDAHEYMRYLLEALHKSCLPPKTPSNAPEHQSKSLMYQIFGGRLNSEVKCTECLQTSNTVDPFMDLSLEIVRAESLPKALAFFTANETLDGQNKYHCAKCKKKVKALKRFTIDTAPNILTIQFKRFGGGAGHYGQKIDKKVRFERTLNLNPYMTPGKKGAVYELYGVLVHIGFSTHSGHYLCFVRTSTDMWHVLDDSRVGTVSEQTVLDQKAYILFYIRKPKANIPPVTKHNGLNGFASSMPKPLVNATPTAAANGIKESSNEYILPPPSTTSQPPLQPANQKLVTEGNDEGVAAKANKFETNGLRLALAECLATSNESEKEQITVTSPQLNSSPSASVKEVSNLQKEEKEEHEAVKEDSEGQVAALAKDCSTERVEDCSTEGGVEGEDVTEESKSVKVNDECLKVERVKGSGSVDECLRNRSYMKLLRAMPKARRLFLTKATETTSSSLGVTTIKTFKKRKADDKPKAKHRNSSKHKSLPKDDDDDDDNDDDARISKISRQQRKDNVAAAAFVSASAPAAAAVEDNELYGSGVGRWENAEDGSKEVEKLLRREHKALSKKSDKWDEEYDRGKVKKIRKGGGQRLSACRSGFEISNPFQALASGVNESR